MKIAWVNDFKVGEMIGGNNTTSRLMIKKGRELGHEITEISHKDDDFPLEEIKKFDLLILNNINMFKKETIEWIIKNTNYIKYEHDYCFCEFRNARCEGCPIKCTPAQLFMDLFSKSQLNIFFSPLQLEIYKKFFGWAMMRKAIYIPAPMEKDTFFPDLTIQQQDAYLFAGVIAQHKGIHQILDYAASQKGKIFHFAGKAIDKKAMEIIKDKHHYLGEVKSEDMPKLYRKYKHFVINPQMPESFCLGILEAMSSGCSIIKFAKSKKTGLESYEVSPTEIIDMCIKAPEVFWEKVKNVTDKKD